MAFYLKSATDMCATRNYRSPKYWSIIDLLSTINIIFRLLFLTF